MNKIAATSEGWKGKQITQEQAICCYTWVPPTGHSTDEADDMLVVGEAAAT